MCSPTSPRVTLSFWVGTPRPTDPLCPKKRGSVALFGPFSAVSSRDVDTDRQTRRAQASAPREFERVGKSDRPPPPTSQSGLGRGENAQDRTRELRARGAAARSVCGWGAGRLALALETFLHTLTLVGTQNAGFRRGATLNMGRHHPLQITSEGVPFKSIKPGNVAIRARVDTHVATQTARHGKSHSLGAGRHSTLWRYTAR